jgi:hypothetical protein
MCSRASRRWTQTVQAMRGRALLAASNVELAEPDAYSQLRDVLPPMDAAVGVGLLFDDDERPQAAIFGDFGSEPWPVIDRAPMRSGSAASRFATRIWYRSPSRDRSRLLDPASDVGDAIPSPVRELESLRHLRIARA